MEYNTQGLLETNPGLAWAIIIGVIALVVIMIASMWKIFTKAGEPGWAAIVPIYNTIVLVRIVKKPVWWAVIILIGGIIPIVGPIAALIFNILVMVELAKVFGKSGGFAAGLILLGFVFFPILAFGDAQYEGAEKDSNPDLLDA